MTGETEQGQAESRQLVVIGSSAGGIDALARLVGTLPAGFPAPIVIAQHLDPTRRSSLHGILEQRSSLPVRIVDDHTTLEPGVVFVVPANRHVLVTSTAIDLRADGGAGRPMPAIDPLLESAAAAYGDRLIAVILTGMGSDGAAGARAVKKLGGTVVIQNPNTAAHPGMPRSLAPNTVDVVADLERIGPILYDLLTGLDVPSRPGEDRQLTAFLEQVRDAHGIDFGSYKLPTIRRRLQRRIVATGTGNIQGYLAYLEASPHEYEQLISTFLIKVTDFFRDPDIFAYLRDTVIPELIEQARRRDRELRIWSAGCATGEEAYSLAMLVAEALGHKLADWNIRIFATDLDPGAITFARQGIYSSAAVEGLPQDLIARCFTVEDGFYQVRKDIRALTVFGQHDLGQRAPFPRIDLVLCRNVLIYFTQELQKRALQLFAYSLRDRGLLVLGKAESTSPLSEYFTLEHHQFRVYRREGERILMPTGPRRYPLTPERGVSAPPVAARLPRGDRRATGRDEGQLLNLPVGMIMVDRRYDIRSINGVARRLLGIYDVAIDADLIHVAPSLPSRTLREAIDRAFQSGETTNVPPFAVEEPLSDSRRTLQLTCYPRRREEERGPVEAVLIVINDLSDTLRDRDAVGALGEGGDANATATPEERDRQFARLVTLNRQLMEANQGLLAANEELRAANEEFVLSVEEAQASTEEIETLNEEMQATVEELNTTNDELHARSVELQEVAEASEEERARLAVILNTMADAVLVLNRNGIPVLANAAYERLFGLPDTPIAADDLEGRPLPREATPHGRALQGVAFSMEFTVAGPRGERRWFEAECRPGLDAAGRLQWSILAIRDITDRSLHRLQEQFISLASHELRTPLTTLQGYLQMLDRQFRQPPVTDRASQFVTTSLKQVERLKRLVTDLLDVVRLQNGKLTLEFQPLELGPVVAQAVEQAQMMTDRPIRLETGDEALRVSGDAGRLEQVLLNLLSNAITHAPGADHIDVRLRRVGAEAAIEVQDYGPGIPPDELPNLFSRFYQVARAGPTAQRGLGLGLFIVHELVVAHGGAVAVNSVEGRGSTFTVRLPLLPGADENE
jgi:two-component system CheB/CheR fusion protein